MKIYELQGECNQCGNCCENTPWWSGWPSNVRNWSPEEVAKKFPQAKFFPLPTHGGPVKGVAEMNGEEFPYEWVEGHAVVKSPTCHECPFLTGVKGDEKRPCAIYDTQYQYMWDTICKVSPKKTCSNKTQVDNWFKACPDCSFEYVEVEAE